MKIASPHPEEKQGERIIANDIALPTLSKSTFDLPNRKDVISLNPPMTKVTTTSTTVNLLAEPKQPVEKIEGTLFHGLPSNIEPMINHGMAFKQVNPQIINEERSAGVTMAHNAEVNAGKILDATATSDHMVLPIVTNNKREKNDLAFQDNKALEQRLDELRNTPYGAAAA
jgi:hypothetical protein